MAVAHGSESTANADADASVVVTKPTGLAAGDFMLAFCVREASSEGFATPAGWTSLNANNFGTQLSTAVFGKVADSSDAAATNFTFAPAGTLGDGSSVALVRVTGQGFGTPAGNTVDTSATDSTGAFPDETVSFAGLTPLAANSMLYMFLANSDVSSNITFGSYAVANNNPSWTELYDVSEFSERFQWALAYGAYASAGATGNFSANTANGDSGDYVGVLVAVNESGNVTVSPNVITATLSIQAPTVAGGANVSPTVVTVTLTVQAPTVTTPANIWLEQSESSTAWTEQSQS